jgi:S-adenosylmethionine/arginine decarboxylase-like enzyme
MTTPKNLGRFLHGDPTPEEIQAKKDEIEATLMSPDRKKGKANIINWNAYRIGSSGVSGVQVSAEYEYID